jgi:hypothetical protein
MGFIATVLDLLCLAKMPDLVRCQQVRLLMATAAVAPRIW